MKKYISLVAVVAAMSMTSCSDFLDVQPEGYATSTSAFKSDQQTQDLIDGLYYKLGNDGGLFGRTLMYEQVGANDMVWGRNRSFNDLALNKFNGDESPLREEFNDFYMLTARANNIINGLLAEESLSPVRTRSLGEALFMRALYHFNIAYRYGLDTQGVPFDRYEDDPNYILKAPTQQKSVMDDYKMIIEDLDKAMEYLPRFESYSEAEQGRPHKAAALGLKAKVYAYWAAWDASQWDNVISCVNDLEQNYGRALCSSFDVMFSCEYSDFWNSEYIFGLTSDGGPQGGGCPFPGITLENKAWGKYNGWGYFKPTNDIYEEMLKDGADNDRLKKSILCYNDEFVLFGETRKFYSEADNEAGFAIRKYYKPFEKGSNGTPDYKYICENGDFPTARMNYPIIRFADLMLLRAEANIMKGNAGAAKSDIDKIRQRSGIAALAANPTMADLYHERRCELAFEAADHLHDLKRWSHCSDATIKAIALAELNAKPVVRHYADRANPESTFTLGGYDAIGDAKAEFKPHMIVFPYPSKVVIESNGALKQNPGY